MDYALTTQNLSIEFGGLKAVDNLNLNISAGSIFGIIGPNGAGKTTVFNMLTGVYQPTAGEIIANGRNIIGKKPYEISTLGISRTFQNIRLFKDLTVAENVLIAVDRNPRSLRNSLLSTVFRSSRFMRNEESKFAQVTNFLEVINLQARAGFMARNLPYGDQRRLEIARALATGSKIILLDEPAAGMTSSETEDLIKMIGIIRERFGITIILIEHDMDLVMRICERIAVLDYGKKICEGSPKEVQCNEKVIEAYLGRKKTEENQQ